jgi:deazaflavin-dependent oxidoreductase (nitroreductase family)
MGQDDRREAVAERLARVAGEENGYLTTTGRASGEPREIEIWFGAHDGHMYLLAGGGEDTGWVRNLVKSPEVAMRVGGATFGGRGRIVRAAEEPEEDALARRLLAAKYERWREGRPMSSWARIALPVAIDVMDVRESAG